MDVNITLISILVIVLLFIPGFFFKRFYYSGQFTKQFNAGTFAERFITSIFWGLIIQFITLVMWSKFTATQYKDVRLPLTKFYTDLSSSQLPDCSANGFFYGIGYIFSSIFIAIVLGAIFHSIVRLLQLDVFIPVLRFTNYWNYYFKGDLYNLRGNRQKGKVISTNIDVIVEDGAGKNKLYSGFLAHYTISAQTGELATIALAKAERWSESSKTFKPILGDNFIIPYNKVVNLNMRYNIKSGSRKKTLEVILDLLCIISFGLILFLIPYYYYNSLRWFKTLLALIIALIDWLFLFGLFIQLFNQNRSTSQTVNSKSKLSYIITSLVIIAGSSYCLYLILQS